MTSLVELLLFFAFMYPIIFAVMLVLDVLGAWVVLRNCLAYSHNYRRRGPCGETPPVAAHDHNPPVIDLAEVERVRRPPPRCRTLALLGGGVKGRPDLACVCEDVRRERMICICRNLRGTVSSML